MSVIQLNVLFSTFKEKWVKLSTINDVLKENRESKCKFIILSYWQEIWQAIVYHTSIGVIVVQML